MPNGDLDGMGSDDPGHGHHPGDRYMVELAFVRILIIDN